MFGYEFYGCLLFAVDIKISLLYKQILVFQSFFPGLTKPGYPSRTCIFYTAPGLLKVTFGAG